MLYIYRIWGNRLTTNFGTARFKSSTGHYTCGNFRLTTSFSEGGNEVCAVTNGLGGYDNDDGLVYVAFDDIEGVWTKEYFRASITSSYSTF